MSLTLTRDELKAVTGAKRKSGIIRELRRRGWIFEIGSDGWAIVSASYANQRLGAIDARPSAWQPDFTKLRSSA